MLENKRMGIQKTMLKKVTVNCIEKVKHLLFFNSCIENDQKI